MKKMSVVIPTYKRPDLLIICLEHLEEQSLPKDEFEVLIVSDGFDESTQLAVFKYLEKSMLHIRYLHTIGKKGPAAARNMGWQNAEANLIAFTDDDCQPDRDWLTVFLNNYTEEKYMVFSGFTKVPLPEYPSDFALNTYHLQTAAFITANCACTFNALEAVNGFDERYRAAWREDSDLQFKFLDLNIPIKKINEAVVVHPVRTNTPWNVSIKEQKKGLYDALLFKKFPDRYRHEIQPRPLWNYYLIVLSSVLFIISLIFRWPVYISVLCMAFSLALIAVFFYRRVKRLPKTAGHIKPMLLTSFAIPFVSVYWRWYGAFKFRVFFI